MTRIRKGNIVFLVILLILFLFSIRFYHASSSIDVDDMEYKILEVVTNEKYQELTYFCSGFEPININDLSSDTDNLYKNLSLLPTLKLTGNRKSTYKDVIDNSSTNKFTQLGFFEKNPDGLGEYKPVYFDSSQSYNIYRYNSETKTYSLVDDISSSPISSLFYLINDRYYSYKDIQSTPKNSKYILYFEKVNKKGVVKDSWDFKPAFSGRYYEINNDNLFTFKKELKTDYYDTWSTLSDARFNNALRIKDKRTVIEEFSNQNISIENRNLLSTIVNTNSIGVKVVRYDDLTDDLIKKADLVYFNTKNSNNDLSDIYEKYNKGVLDDNSSINITKSVGVAIIDRIYSNSLNVIFDDTSKSHIDVSKLNNFGVLYTLLNSTYASIIKNGKLLDNSTLVSMFDTDTSLNSLFSKVPVNNKTVDAYSKFNINNIDLSAPTVLGHSVFSLQKGIDILKDFNNDVIQYSSYTSKAFNFFNKKSSDKLTLYQAFDFLINQKEVFDLDNKVRILEVEPCNVYLSDDYWYWRMYGINPKYKGVVEVTKMTSREFISKNDDLLSKYDIVYIGSSYSGSYFRQNKSVQSIFYRTNCSVGLYEDEVRTFNISSFVSCDSDVVITSVSNCQKLDDKTFAIKGDSINSCKVSFKVSNTSKVHSILINYYISSKEKKTAFNKNKLLDKLNNYSTGYYKIDYNNSLTKVRDDNFKYIDAIPVKKKSEGINLRVNKLGMTLFVVPYKVENNIKIATLGEAIKVDFSDRYDKDLVFELNGADYIAIYFKNSFDNYISELKGSYIFNINLVVNNKTSNTYDMSGVVSDYNTNNYKTFKVDLDDTSSRVIVNGLKISSSSSSNFDTVFRVYGIRQDNTKDELFKGILNIYVLDEPTIKSVGIGFPVEFTDNSMNGKLYTKLGDKYNNFYNQNPSSIYYTGITSLDTGNRTTRGSGNDFSIKKYNELNKFINANKIVLLSDAFYFEDSLIDSKFDISSNVYKLARNKKVLKDSSNVRLNVNDVFSVEFSKIPQVYKDKTYTKNIDLKEYTGVDGSSASSTGSYYLNGDNIDFRTLSYKFKINAKTSSNVKYSVSLFIDSVSDGLFDSKEELRNVSIKDSNGNSIKFNELIANNWYTLSKDLSAEISGVVHWQLNFKQSDNALVRKNYDYYTAVLPRDDSKKKELNILQLCAFDGYNGSSTFNMEKSQELRKLLNNISDFDIKIVSLNEPQLYENEKLKNIQVSDKLLSPYDFDMLVIGCNDAGNYATRQKTLDLINSYIESGKSVVFTHDTNSYVNLYNKLPYNGGSYSNKSYNNLAFFENKYFRNVIGQDRYGVSLYDNISYGNLINNNFSDFLIFSKSRKEFTEITKNIGKDIPSGTDGSDISLVGSAEGLSDYLLKGTWINTKDKLTTKAECVNFGQISYYPYYIEPTVNIASTHAQYYQLDMNDEDLNVWYTLSGDSNTGEAYKDDLKNGRELYYIYNKGNITYSGVGNSSNITDMELKLFVNTLVMAYRESSTAPKLDVLNQNAQNIDDKSYIYLDYSVDEPQTALDKNLDEDDIVNVYFKINNNSSIYNKQNYISIEYSGVDNNYDKHVYDSKSNTELPKASNGLYKIPSSGLFYVRCNIDELKNELGIYSDSSAYQIEFKCKLYTSYGTIVKKDIKSEKTVVLVKRGLFDIH